MIKSSVSMFGDSEKRPALIFCLFVFAIYSLYPTKSFYWDGIIYARFIEDASGFGAQLLHPNHLFYNVLGYLTYQATQGFGLQVRALFVLQFVTIVFGGLCAFVFFLAAKNTFRSTYLSVSMTALFAFSAAWWRFSTDADVYIISVFFLLISFFLILPDQPPRPLLVAVTHASGMFFHQLAVLFFPAVVLGLIFQTSELERRKRILIILHYSVTAFLVTLGVYYLCFYLQTGSFDFKDFVKWMTSYAPAAGFRLDIWENLRLTLRGHRQLFIDGSSGLFQRGFLNFILLAVFSASVIFFLFRTGRNLREIKSFWKSIVNEKIYRQPAALLCVVWTIPYLVFLFFFTPENTFYRLFYFPALIILVGIFLLPFENLKRIRQWRLALFVLIFSLYNFLFYIQPNSQVRENTPFALALQANNVWSNKTVIFYEKADSYDSLETNNRLVKYFNPAVAWKPLDSITLKEFENKISEINSNGGTVWLESQAIKRMMANPQTAQWLSDNSVQPAKSELAVPKYDIRFIQLIPKSFGKENLTL